MPVVTQQGLVGRISRVTAAGANVQLITDPAMNINVRLQPSRERAVLSGSITGDLTLRFYSTGGGCEPWRFGAHLRIWRQLSTQYSRLVR